MKARIERILEDKKRDQVLEALRGATETAMPLGEFVSAVRQMDAVKEVADEITLEELFAGILPVETPGVKSRSWRARKSRRMSDVRRAVGQKARAKIVTKPRRQRAGADTVGQRLQAIVEVLDKNGEWMKTGEIFAVLSRTSLFAGVKPNLLSQYLVRLTREKPSRIQRRGAKAGSAYKHL